MSQYYLLHNSGILVVKFTILSGSKHQPRHAATDNIGHDAAVREELEDDIKHFLFVLTTICVIAGCLWSLLSGFVRMEGRAVINFKDVRCSKIKIKEIICKNLKYIRVNSPWHLPWLGGDETTQSKIENHSNIDERNWQTLRIIKIKTFPA